MIQRAVFRFLLPHPTLMRGLVGLNALPAATVDGRALPARLQLAPQLPASWDRLTIRNLRWQGVTADVTVRRDAGGLSVSVAPRGGPLPLELHAVLPPGARQELALLARMTVPGKHGPVMIGNVASLRIDSGPAEIDRYDRQRNINFEIELNQQPLGLVESQAMALPSIKNLPPGVTQTTIGDAEAMNELFASFGLAMLTGVLCIYIVLVMLFKGFVQPATILVALVLSIPGAFLALFITRTALSMPSMIGMVMLMIALSATFSYGIIWEHLPENLAAFMVSISSVPWVAMLIIILAFVPVFSLSGEEGKLLTLQGAAGEDVVVLGGMDITGASFVKVEGLKFTVGDAMKGRRVFVNVSKAKQSQIARCEPAATTPCIMRKARKISTVGARMQPTVASVKSTSDVSTTGRRP